MSNEEPKAEFVSVRRFLHITRRGWARKTLYLDGLDELRAKTADGARVLDQLISKLVELGCPKFRLSCRAIDWYGSSDLNALKDATAGEPITVLRFEPLTERDISTIAADKLSDPSSFIDGSKRLGLYGLLTNPQTLDLFLTAMRDDSWPETLTALYEAACDILAEEPTEEHGRVRQAAVGGANILQAAGRLFATHLCGGTEGFALST